MATVKLTINGREVEIEQGSTILQAAKKAGIYVPTLCYHPFLPLEEACRICVVEEIRGGWSSQVAACVYPVRNGMVIETDSEKILDARRTIMELLLSNHPNDCMTCYATGECELQDMAHRYRVKDSVFRGARQSHPVDPDPNPVLHLDMNKCILCRRCIRACHDVEGADIWTKVGRGFEQRISTAFDLPLDEAGCESCGHCADFCPVDAIGFRAGRGTVRAWQYRRSSTVCLQCASGCRAEYDTFHGKVVRVLGDFNSPANSGALCKRGRFNLDFMNSPERLTTAFVRNESGTPEAVSVEEGLRAAAQGLKRVRDQRGENSLAVLCGGSLTNEEYYLAQKLARGALATNHVDSVGGPWQQAMADGLSGVLGIGASTNPLSDIARAGAVLVLGSDTLEKHAIAALRARKAAREGAVLLVAHPEKVLLTKTATLHLPMKNGSEGALLAGILKTVVAEGLHDRNYVAAHTQDFQKLEKSLEKINLSSVAGQTGIAEEKIREAARLFAGKKPACLVYGIDPGTSPDHESFYRLCAMLPLLLGSIGTEGGGVHVLGAAGNAQGALDFGATAKYAPGLRPATSAAVRKHLSRLWGVEVAGKPGKNWPEIFASIEKGEIRGLVLIGLNPFELGYPRTRVEGALARLDFLLCQDALRTPALEYAHVTLPGATFVEKDGTATNCERRVQPMVRSLESPGDARQDFDLLNSLLGLLHPGLEVPGRGAAFSQAAESMAELQGLQIESLPVEGIQWPVSADGRGMERLLPPEEGKARFKFFPARI